MNERIKLLVKQAGGIQYDEDGDELTAILVGKDLAKFAELIIKECLLYTIPSNNTANNTETDRALAWAHQNIREHFGVEE